MKLIYRAIKISQFNEGMLIKTKKEHEDNRKP